MAEVEAGDEYWKKYNAWWKDAEPRGSVRQSLVDLRTMLDGIAARAGEVVPEWVFERWQIFTDRYGKKDELLHSAEDTAVTVGLGYLTPAVVGGVVGEVFGLVSIGMAGMFAGAKADKRWKLIGPKQMYKREAFRIGEMFGLRYDRETGERVEVPWWKVVGRVPRDLIRRGPMVFENWTTQVALGIDRKRAKVSEILLDGVGVVADPVDLDTFKDPDEWEAYFAGRMPNMLGDEDGRKAIKDLVGNLAALDRLGYKGSVYGPEGSSVHRVDQVLGTEGVFEAAYEGLKRVLPDHLHPVAYAANAQEPQRPVLATGGHINWGETRAGEWYRVQMIDKLGLTTADIVNDTWADKVGKKKAKLTLERWGVVGGHALFGAAKTAALLGLVQEVFGPPVKQAGKTWPVDIQF